VWGQPPSAGLTDEWEIGHAAFRVDECYLNARVMRSRSEFPCEPERDGSVWYDSNLHPSFRGLHKLSNHFTEAFPKARHLPGMRRINYSAFTLCAELKDIRFCDHVTLSGLWLHEDRLLTANVHPTVCRLTAFLPAHKSLGEEPSDDVELLCVLAVRVKLHSLECRQGSG